MTAEVPTDSPTPSRTSLPVRLALLALPLVLLVVLTELVLWGLDLGGPRSLPPTGRGFDTEAAYLARDAGGGWVTQVVGDPEREVHIAPRDERRRVLLFGGSNTQLLPEAYLEEVLNAADPSGPGWDVVNLGRNGYGSARVVILLEQALARLEPDLVFVYSGHNEFVEAGFKFEVEQALGSTLDGASSWLTELRMFRMIEAMARPAASPPTDIDPAEDAYGDITWEGTQQVYAAYAENLRRMARACARDEVPVIFGTVIGNDWNVPWISQLSRTADLDPGAALDDESETAPHEPPGDTSPDDVALDDGTDSDADEPDDEPLSPDEVLRRKTIRTLSAVSLLIPERFRLWDGGKSPPRLRVGRWIDKGDTDWDPGPVPEHTGALADPPAWSRDDPRQDSVAGAYWPAPQGWHGSVRDVVARAHAHLGPIELTEDERVALQHADAGVDVLLRVHPSHARALFLKGQIQWLLGDPLTGAKLLRKAATLDCAPRRGNFHTNTHVRTVADEFPGAALFDIATDFRTWSPHGLVGYALMMDGCHLQPGARRVLLAQLAPQLIAAVAP